MYSSSDLYKALQSRLRERIVGKRRIWKVTRANEKIKQNSNCMRQAFKNNKTIIIICILVSPFISIMFFWARILALQIAWIMDSSVKLQPVVFITNDSTQKSWHCFLKYLKTFSKNKCWLTKPLEWGDNLGRWLKSIRIYTFYCL